MFWQRLCVLLTIFLFGSSVAAEDVKDTRPHLWSIGIVQGSSLLSLEEDRKYPNPRLTARDLKGLNATFVADPFLIREGNRFYLFFEYMNSDSSRGEIGVAESLNGFNWRFTGRALVEPFHLSYPYVFKHAGAYYMIPESRAANSVRLYRAKEFPLKWEFQQTLFEGPYADSSIAHYADRWWIFTEKRAYTLSIWSAGSLYGPWSEHPRSPVYNEDPSRGRPGGRLVEIGGSLLRFSQDNVGGYGKKLRAFQITKLTPEAFQEQSLDPDPLFGPTGSTWRFNGMHHLSAVRAPRGGWIAAVDGNGVPEREWEEKR